MTSISPSLSPLQQLIYYKGIDKLRQQFYADYNAAEEEQRLYLYDHVNFETDVIKVWDISTPVPFIRTLLFSDLLEHYVDHAASSASLFISQSFDKSNSTQHVLIAKNLKEVFQLMLLQVAQHPIISKYSIVTTALLRLIQDLNVYCTDLGELTSNGSFTIAKASSKKIAPSFFYEDPNEVNAKGNEAKSMTRSALGVRFPK